MEAIRTNKGALISPSVFQQSEKAFLASFPDNYKLIMFNGCETVKDCEKELKWLYAIHGKHNKKAK